MSWKAAHCCSMSVIILATSHGFPDKTTMALGVSRIIFVGNPPCSGNRTRTQDRFQPWREARTVRARVRRNVCIYATDLVKSAASWLRVVMHLHNLFGNLVIGSELPSRGPPLKLAPHIVDNYHFHTAEASRHRMRLFLLLPVGLVLLVIVLPDRLLWPWELAQLCR